jgi:hypothetical protein
VRALQTRVQKLERDSGDAQLFYILWVPAGADRVAALDQLRASGKIPADVPAYCAEWKPPNHRRVLGPCPRSRLTDHQRISDDEEAVLSKATCDDLESGGVSFTSSASDDVRDHRFNEMTNRELLGIMLADMNDAFVRAYRR